LNSFLLLIPVAHLLACGPAEQNPAPEPQVTTAAPLVLYASNYPLQYFAERIAGPLAEVRFPAAQWPDPAYWEPSAGEVLAMQEADLILLNGASYEQWLKSVTLPPSRLVDTTAGLQERLLRLEESITHSHGPEGDHEHAGTAFTTWLDLSLAAQQARAIETALAALLPGQSAVFRARSDELVAELLALDAQMRELTAATTEESGVVYSHPVYQYFQRRYGVVGPSVHWEPGETPDAQGWAELDRAAATSEARWMIWEAAPVDETVARLGERGLSSVVIDPCAKRPAEGDFSGVMRRNLEALRQICGS
jgi:zinc transport system substrate-binding protein